MNDLSFINNDRTKNATIRDVRLNDRSLHALDIARAINYAPGGYMRFEVEFKT